MNKYSVECTSQWSRHYFFFRRGSNCRAEHKEAWWTRQYLGWERGRLSIEHFGFQRGSQSFGFSISTPNFPFGAILLNRLQNSGDSPWRANLLNREYWYCQSITKLSKRLEKLQWKPSHILEMFTWLFTFLKTIIKSNSERMFLSFSFLMVWTKSCLYCAVISNAEEVECSSLYEWHITNTYTSSTLIQILLIHFKNVYLQGGKTSGI